MTTRGEGSVGLVEVHLENDHVGFMQIGTHHQKLWGENLNTNQVDFAPEPDLIINRITVNVNSIYPSAATPKSHP